MLLPHWGSEGRGAARHSNSYVASGVKPTNSTGLTLALTLRTPFFVGAGVRGGKQRRVSTAIYILSFSKVGHLE